jgi:tryptophan-rich sensory protein
VGFVGLCLLAGAADAGLVTHAARTWYPSVAHPPGTPPILVFPCVWAGLAVTTGIAGWLVWRKSGASHPLRLWGWQLAAGAAWPPAFFGIHNPALGLAVTAAVAVLLCATVHSFVRSHRFAAGLMFPCIAWTGFYAYLSAGFWWLNPS